MGLERRPAWGQCLLSSPGGQVSGSAEKGEGQRAQLALENMGQSVFGGRTGIHTGCALVSRQLGLPDSGLSSESLAQGPVCASGLAVLRAWVSGPSSLDFLPAQG